MGKPIEDSRVVANVAFLVKVSKYRLLQLFNSKSCATFTDSLCLKAQCKELHLLCDEWLTIAHRVTNIISIQASVSTCCSYNSFFVCYDQFELL
jgi:hypothetical protein